MVSPLSAYLFIVRIYTLFPKSIYREINIEKELGKRIEIRTYALCALWFALSFDLNSKPIPM